MTKPFASLILILLLALPVTAMASSAAAAAAAAAATVAASTNRQLPVPAATGYVVDQAEILSPETELALAGLIEALDQADSTQLAVLTIPSLKGNNLEAYALKVAETWGIGQKGKDNGALLLIAQKERKVRIEVGYGLEGRLTDLLAGRIIRNEITPRFKEGDFDGGVRAGVEAMIQAVKGEHQATTTTARETKANPTALLILDIAGLVFLACLVVAALGAFRESYSPPPRNRPGRETARTRPEERPARREETDTYVVPPVVPPRRSSSSKSDDSDDSSGSSFGGFGGGRFGGGRFGGGGASGGW